MAETVYLLCALMSVLCAGLLIRSWAHSRARLLLWSTLCFGGLAVNNILLFVDLILVPEINLASLRTIVALFSVTVLVIALVWEHR